MCLIHQLILLLLVPHHKPLLDTILAVDLPLRQLAISLRRLARTSTEYLVSVELRGLRLLPFNHSFSVLRLRPWSFSLDLRFESTFSLFILMFLTKLLLLFHFKSIILFLKPFDLSLEELFLLGGISGVLERICDWMQRNTLRHLKLVVEGRRGTNKNRVMHTTGGWIRDNLNLPCWILVGL